MLQQSKFFLVILIAFPVLAHSSAAKIGSNLQLASVETVDHAYKLLQSSDPQERSEGLRLIFSYRQSDIDNMPIIVKGKNGELCYQGKFAQSKSAAMFDYFEAGNFVYDTSEHHSLVPRLVLGATSIPTMKEYVYMFIPQGRLNDFKDGASYKIVLEALAKHRKEIEPSLKPGIPVSGSAGAVAAVQAHAALSTDFPVAAATDPHNEIASTTVPGGPSIVHDGPCQGASAGSNLNNSAAENLEKTPVLPSGVTLQREGKKFVYSSASTTACQFIGFNGETIILGGGKAHAVNLTAISSSSIVSDKLCSIVITYE